MPNEARPPMPDGGRAARARAWFVHLLTASGVVFDLGALLELCRPDPDPRRAFVWLAVPVIIDAVDGPLARRWDVKRWAAAVDGRTLDDIVDYLTFTLVPLLMVTRMGWVPSPAWIVPPLLASLVAFGHREAKQEAEGFFRGFPSYWNVFAFYAGIWAAWSGPVGPAALAVVLTVLTVSPLRFVYPNLAPPPWRLPVIAGAVAWTAILAAMLPSYPRVPPWLLWGSLAYPVFYVALSMVLDRRARGGRPAAVSARPLPSGPGGRR